jgi:hypothetical protein
MFLFDLGIALHCIALHVQDRGIRESMGTGPETEFRGS